MEFHYAKFEYRNPTFQGLAFQMQTSTARNWATGDL